MGDGRVPRSRGAVLAALRLVEQLPAAGLPPAHVGVAAGPVVVQGGDYFGRTVNLAARIAAYASAESAPGERARGPGGAAPGLVTFVEPDRGGSKGIADPDRLLEARRAQLNRQDDPEAQTWIAAGVSTTWSGSSWTAPSPRRSNTARVVAEEHGDEAWIWSSPTSPAAMEPLCDARPTHHPRRSGLRRRPGPAPGRCGCCLSQRCRRRPPGRSVQASRVTTNTGRRAEPRGLVWSPPRHRGGAQVNCLADHGACLGDLLLEHLAAAFVVADRPFDEPQAAIAHGLLWSPVGGRDEPVQRHADDAATTPLIATSHGRSRGPDGEQGVHS